METKNEFTVTGERVTPGLSSKRNEEDHVARYAFASRHISGKAVLDIACGTGFGTAMLADSGALSVTGVDIAPEAIQYAEQNFKRENCRFMEGTVASLPFQDEQFDTIVTFETIEHLDDETRACYLGELHRVLKNDGTMLLSTPNKNIVSPWTKKPGNKFHVLEYTQPRLQVELQAAGFLVQAWYGQRLVHKLYALKIIRLLEVARCRMLGKTSERYFIANGPEVLSVPKGYTPRYFILEAKKT